MSKLVMGILVLVVLFLVFLLFWMITLGLALLLFRKKEPKGENFLTGKSETL